VALDRKNINSGALSDRRSLRAERRTHPFGAHSTHSATAAPTGDPEPVFNQGNARRQSREPYSRFKRMTNISSSNQLGQNRSRTLLAWIAPHITVYGRSLGMRSHVIGALRNRWGQDVPLKQTWVKRCVLGRPRSQHWFPKGRRCFRRQSFRQGVATF